jgi:hypothetical protein
MKQKGREMRKSSFVGLTGNRIERVSGRPVRAERAGRPGVDRVLGDSMGRAPRTQDAFLSSPHCEADERDDDLNAARGGMIAVLFGLFAWTLILFSVRQLLS